MHMNLHQPTFKNSICVQQLNRASLDDLKRLYLILRWLISNQICPDTWWDQAELLALQLREQRSLYIYGRIGAARSSTDLGGRRRDLSLARNAVGTMIRRKTNERKFALAS